VINSSHNEKQQAVAEPGGAGVLKPLPTTLASMEAPPTNFVEEEEGRRKF